MDIRMGKRLNGATELGLFFHHQAGPDRGMDAGPAGVVHFAASQPSFWLFTGNGRRHDRVGL